jgi:hypothetical protein
MDGEFDLMSESEKEGDFGAYVKANAPNDVDTYTKLLRDLRNPESELSKTIEETDKQFRAARKSRRKRNQ